MKTYYDGEEREILEIAYWTTTPKGGAVFKVRYKRGESVGEIVFPATDELDAFNKFPEYLAEYSINNEE